MESLEKKGKFLLMISLVEVTEPARNEQIYSHQTKKWLIEKFSICPVENLKICKCYVHLITFFDMDVLHREESL